MCSSYAACAVLPQCRRPGSFALGERRFRYVREPYNSSWRNERAVEIPLARAFLATRGGRTAEVGNVLSHYGPMLTELVIDRYERAPGVTNLDVLDWRPASQLDAVVSISTIEHIGFDEDPSEPGKSLRAIAHLQDLLSEDGELFITLPIGHNPEVDAALAQNRAGAVVSTYFVRRRLMRWEETCEEEALKQSYSRGERSARAVFVGIWSSRATTADRPDQLVNALLRRHLVTTHRSSDE